MRLKRTSLISTTRSTSGVNLFTTVSTIFLSREVSLLKKHRKEAAPNAATTMCQKARQPQPDRYGHATRTRELHRHLTTSDWESSWQAHGSCLQTTSTRGQAASMTRSKWRPPLCRPFSNRQSESQNTYQTILCTLETQTERSRPR